MYMLAFPFSSWQNFTVSARRMEVRGAIRTLPDLPKQLRPEALFGLRGLQWRRLRSFDGSDLIPNVSNRGFEQKAIIVALALWKEPRQFGGNRLKVSL